VVLPVSRGTGPWMGAISSRLGAPRSRLHRIGLLSSRAVLRIALLGERERGGSKRDSNRETQSFHADHFAFSFPPIPYNAAERAEFSPDMGTPAFFAVIEWCEDRQQAKSRDAGGLTRPAKRLTLLVGSFSRGPR